MEFSLFYFSGDGLTERPDKYRLLLEGARFADQHDFTAVWTPERHFEQFGGLYPNPAITSAALAVTTRRVQIRAGSVVQPLQDPLRVAEAWSMIDNLSGGRVAVAFASGWHVNDFVLAPSRYAERHVVLYRDVEIIRRLWAGDALSLPNGAGRQTNVRVLPRPIQKQLPIWITSQSDESFVRAGERGFNVLTNMNYKTIDTLGKKLALYREAAARAGHGRGHATVMTHAFVIDDAAAAERIARPALRGYLSTNLALQDSTLKGSGDESPRSQMSPRHRQTLLDAAVERVIAHVGLIGSADSCRERVERWRSIGVDEIACLIDFGIPDDEVLASLPWLARLKDRTQRDGTAERLVSAQASRVSA